jgi:hypothetical protein
VTDQHGIDAFTLRFGTATKRAVKTGSVSHPVNPDLTNFPDGLGSYSKALLQGSPGGYGAKIGSKAYLTTQQLCDESGRHVKLG